jgi:hypothetical protein
MSKTQLFTAALNKGQALLPEVHQLAQHWQPGITARKLAQEALAAGYLGRATEARIRDVVAVFSRRFMRGQPQPVVHIHELAQQLPTAGIFTEVCLLHTAAAHPELLVFLQEVYWPAHYASRRDLPKEVAQDFLREAQKLGRTGSDWSEGLTERTARRLTGTLTEFGLLGAPDRQGIRLLRSFQPHPETVVYLAYWLRELHLDVPALLAHPLWQVLGLQSADVLPALRRLTLHNWLTVLSAGDVLRLEWTYPTTTALLHDLTHRSIYAVA